MPETAADKRARAEHRAKVLLRLPPAAGRPSTSSNARNGARAKAWGLLIHAEASLSQGRQGGSLVSSHIRGSVSLQRTASMNPRFFTERHPVMRRVISVWPYSPVLNRCLVAQQIIALLPSTCTYCGERTTRGDLRAHEAGCPRAVWAYAPVRVPGAAAVAEVAAVAAAAAAAAAAEEAAVVPVEERVRQKQAVTKRGIAASMAVAVAVEAYYTWRTYAYLGPLFSLFVHPFVLSILDIVLVFLVHFFMFFLRVMYVDPPVVDFVEETWEVRLSVLVFILSLIIFLLRLVVFQTSLRILLSSMWYVSRVAACKLGWFDMEHVRRMRRV